MKLSVIVPVYNLEDYIGACIESICNQTIQDFELILVNDGSKDNSLQICREYAEKDSRIRVITKPNSGVSATRNMGLDIATGEYVLFVDGDDAVDPKMAEILICDMESKPDTESHLEVVMACCEHQSVYKIPEKIETCYQNKPISYTDSDAELDRMIAWETSCALWDRIYRRDRIGDIRFAEGALTEDKFFNVQYLLKNRGIVSQREEQFYQYLIRDNSSSRVAFSEKFFALQEIAQRTIDEMSGETQVLQESAEFNMFRTKLHLLLYIVDANKQREYKEIVSEYLSYLKEHEAILKKRTLPAKVQRQYRLLKIHPEVLYLYLKSTTCIIQTLLKIRNKIRGY